MLGRFPVAGATLAGTGAAEGSDDTQYAAPGGWDASALGAVTASWTKYVDASGFDALAIGGVYQASWTQIVQTGGFDSARVSLSSDAFAVPVINFDFDSPYTPPAYNLVDFELSQEAGEIVVGGFDAGGFGGAYQVSWRQFAYPGSIYDGLVEGPERIIYSRSADLEFTPPYGPPPGDAADFVLNRQQGTLYPRGRSFAEFGTPALELGARYLSPGGIADGAFGDHVFEKTPEIFPSGIDAASFGSQEVFLWTRYLQPSGHSASSYGTTFVENFNREVSVSGVAPPGFGAASVAKTPELLPSGIGPGKFGFSGDGVGFIALGIRTLEPESLPGVSHGVQRVENQNREIDLAGRAPLDEAFGTQFVAYGQREVFPQFIFHNAFGVPVMGFHRSFGMSGFDASSFGVAEVHDNTQRLESIGLGYSGTFEIPEVSRSPRLLEPPGFDLREIAPSERWGRPEAYNLTQILPRVAIDPGPENGGVFGDRNHTIVENRDRAVVHYGHASSKVSGLAKIENTGRGITLTGIDASTFGTHLVADAIRTYYLEGLEAPWFSPYHAVHNAAAQLLPVGILPAGVGTPAWSNPPQAATFVGHIDSQEHGSPFVDFAIRSVKTPLGPEAIIGMPDVQLGTRYLTPGGLEATKWGATYVYEHFNVAAAHSILAPAAGEPWIRNATPEVMPYGYEMTEWGIPQVRWNPWPLSPDGAPGAQFGSLVIRDRRQTAVPPGLGAGQVGMFAQVRNDTPDPPAQKVIAPSGEVHSSVGVHVVTRNEIAAGGVVFTSFGTHDVRLIGAIVPSIAEPTVQVPLPAVSGPRTMFVSGIKSPDDILSGFVKTKHDLKPRTIWATFAVTDQARENHSGEWVLIDDHLDTFDPRGQRPFWGTPEVSLANRIISVGPASSDMSPKELPAPFVESTIRKIYPSGRLMQRFGVPTVPGPQTLDLDGVGFMDSDVGSTRIENFDKDVIPNGVSSPGFGYHEVQHFHREVLVPSLGEGQAGTPRVHPPEPVIPGMGIQTLWGDAMVADRVRMVYPSGWDSFTIGEEVGDFRDRIRVMKRYPLRPSSIVDGGVGEPRVSDAVQTIEHAGLPGPGKPPAPEIAINSKIALGGLGLWYEGHGQTVITHGDNMEFVCGESSRAIPISGIDESVIGAASLSQ